MIDKTEISPNNRAKCKDCREKILKGMPRGITTIYYGIGYTCYRCTKNRIERFEVHCKQMKIDYAKIMKKCSKRIKTAIIIKELSV